MASGKKKKDQSDNQQEVASKKIKTWKIWINIKEEDVEPVPVDEIDLFSEPAMNNAYAICHNVQVSEGVICRTMTRGLLRISCSTEDIVGWEHQRSQGEKERKLLNSYFLQWRELVGSSCDHTFSPFWKLNE